MMSGDQTFAQAAEAKRGRLQIPAALEPFTERVEQRFGVKPLWIATDHITVVGPRNVRRRVDLVFERTDDYEGFLTGPFNFSSVRQDAIASDFVDTVSTASQSRLFHAPVGKRVADGLFVCFSDFESAAREAAHTGVPMTDIDRMAAEAGFGDAYWESSRLWGPPTLFLYTDEQVKRFSSDDFRGRLDDAYFQLALAHDEFGILERQVTVGLDSKENFDNNYEGNWQYYWK
jgi:hypothetical protein